MKKNISLFLFAAFLVLGVVLGNQFVLAIAGLALLTTAYTFKGNRYFAASLAVLGVFTLVGSVFPELSIGIVGTGGFLTAVTPVIGTQGYESGSDADIFVRDVEETVFMIGRDDFPLTTMKQNLKASKPTNSTKPEWLEDAYYDRVDTVKTAIVSTQAPTSGINTIVVDNPTKFVKGNILVLPGLLTESASNPAGELKAFITAINYSTGAISVRVLNNGTTGIPAVAAGAKLYRGSIAGNEMQAQTEVKHKEAQTKYNYVQRFMGQVETSDLRALLNSYGGDDGEREKKKQVYDFRTSMEFADLFGTPDITMDAEDNTVFLQGGIEHYAGGYIEYTRGAITQATFNTWCRQIFAGNNGSKQRLFLVDEYMLEDILNVPSVDKTLSSKDSEIVFGVKVNKIETSFGTLLLKHHKGFAEFGREYYGLAIDMPNISDRILKPFNAYELNLKKTGQKNVAKAIFMETWKSLRVANANTHTKIIGRP